MNENSINEAYKTIIGLLDSKRLKEALYAIGQFIFGVPEWDLRNLFEETSMSYQYMLEYMERNIEDPEKSKLYNRILSTAYLLADRARILKLTPLSTNFYFDRIRYYKLMPPRTLPELQLELEAYTEETALNNLLQSGNTANGSDQDAKSENIRKRHEQAYTELFYRAWLSDRWTEKEEGEARCLLNSVLVPVNDLSLFVSAVTLSLTGYFDIRKCLFLFDAYRHDSNEVNQRALVGIALTVLQYDRRLSIYPELTVRIGLLQENEKFVHEMNRLQIQLFRSRETKKIDKKMREEIIPEVMKNVNQAGRKLNFEEFDEESFSEDRNPDWEDWMVRSGMNDKLKEMSELQMEGADVYMGTFSQLKTYPFFHNMANWFYPFDIQHPAIVQAFPNAGKKCPPLLENILQSGLFCNSDKYSFALTIMQIPQSQREMMTQQLEAQNSLLKETEQYEKMLAHSQKAETICNQYIQDLYRFFKVHPRRHEFRDLFEESLDLQSCQTVKAIFSRKEDRLTLADYLFAKDYMDEALAIYQELNDNGEKNAEIYQKIGYCLQRNKQYDKAIEAYQMADMQQPDNVWTNRHLAACYRCSKQYRKALPYYKKVEEAQPENLSVLLQTGYCLTELKEYESALAYFFKTEYLGNGSDKAYRAIAWCSFLVRKYDQALKYYAKILQQAPQMQDYLNMGHVLWASGDIQKATVQYVEALRLSKNEDAFFALFDKDKEVLLEAGINGQDLPLMQDLVRYASERKATR